MIAWTPRPAEEWASSVSTVEVPVEDEPWTEKDVQREAAKLWEIGWTVCCQGGTRYFLTPTERLRPLASMYEGETDFAAAVWERFVDVAVAMYGNRHARRRLKKLGHD